MESKRAFSGAPWEKQVGYCRAIRRGSVISVSGTAPVAEDGSVFAPGDAYAQCRRCLQIIERALVELGAGVSDVVRTRMFVTDIALWAEFGRAHAEVFGDHPPATTMVEVKALISPGMLIEIEADAVIGAPSAVSPSDPQSGEPLEKPSFDAHTADPSREPLEIRRAVPGDGGGIAARFVELGYTMSGDEVDLRLATLPQGVAAIFVAVAGPKILGCVTVQKNSLLHRERSDARITALEVSPEARVFGIGRKLVFEAERWARSQGCDRVEVTSGHSRTGAHEFYRKLGYEHTSLRFSKMLQSCGPDL